MPAPKKKEPPDPLVVAIGEECRAARDAAGVKQVRIAANVDVDQSTLARFERGGGWPRHPKSVGFYLRAYADELGLDPAELLHAAVDRWAASQLASDELAATLEAEADRLDEQRAENDAKSRRKPKTRKAP